MRLAPVLAGEERRQALDHVPDALAHLVVILGVEDLPERGGHQSALVAAAMGVHVAHEVHGAPLPGAGEHLGDRVL